MDCKIYNFVETLKKQPNTSKNAIKKALKIDPRLTPLVIFPQDMKMLKREMMLWRTVLIQTMKDASSGEKEAIYWFSYPIFKADFITVCELAGVNKTYVLEIMEDVYSGKIKLPTWRKIRNIWRGEAEKEREKRK